MQTFLPYADYAESAAVLDYRRLGKQRVETYQLLRALNGETRGWVNHPAARMWDGYEYQLAVYGLTVTREWIRRGYKDTMLERFEQLVELYRDSNNLTVPAWLGTPAFHLSHQSNLVRKLPEFYKPLFPDVPDNLEYVWPAAAVA